MTHYLSMQNYDFQSENKMIVSDLYFFDNTLTTRISIKTQIVQSRSSKISKKQLTL